MVFFIGHFNVEDLIYPHYQKPGTAGGACLYAAMGGYIWNPDICVVTRVGSEYPPEYLGKLEQLGIRKAIRVIPGETMAGTTEYRPMQDRVFTMKNRPAKLLELTPDINDVTAAEIPDGSAVHIGPLHPDLLAEIVEYLKTRKNCFVSVDTCDAFVRNDRQKLLSVLRKTDLFIPSRSELTCFFDGEPELMQAGRELKELTGQALIVKDSTRGSYIFREKDVLNIPVYKVADPVDLTGAGDSFCGGLIARYAQCHDIVEAAVCGSVSASFAIEGCGALHYSGTDKNELTKRRNKIYESLGEGK